MVEMNSSKPSDDEADVLIDDVRAIRRSICAQFDNDIERLAEHLRRVEEEYRGRTGRFADVPREPGPDLFTEEAETGATSR
jgi:hypothetical protein